MSFFKFLLKSLTLLQLLWWNVDAQWTNNYTLIKLINSMNSSWKAGINPTDIPSSLPRLPKTRTKKGMPLLVSDHMYTPPSFDSRVHFRRCRSIINRIRNQGLCGSCWAVTVTSVLSDRICIETDGATRLHLSAEDVITCCDFCKPPGGHSCAGGYHEFAIQFWTREGIVTGGETGTNHGCKPYSRASLEGLPQPCIRRCTKPNYWRGYKKDKSFGKIVYRVPPTEEAIRKEIFSHGPVAAGILVYPDLKQYRTGVYQSLRGMNAEFDHAVKIIGWGEEHGVKYWLVANSWGVNFGSKGYIKILRGENHCGIESNVVAGRMSDRLDNREMLREAGIAHGNTRNVLHADRMFLYSLCIWTLVDSL